MDPSNSQQQQTRRNDRSAANLPHLSLAPLTRLPLHDVDYSDGMASVAVPSYLQGRSVPTTPRLLSRSPTSASPPSSRSRSAGRRTSARLQLPKSLSTTHLAAGPSRHAAPHSDAHGHGYGRRHGHDDADDSGWLLRTGAIVTSETREVKGQSWLATRASSTSLAGLRGHDDEPYREHQHGQHEHDQHVLFSNRSSRRGSWHLHHDDEAGWGVGVSRLGSRVGSRAGSRAGSRLASRTGSRVQLHQLHQLPLEGRQLQESGGGSGYVDYFESRMHAVAGSGVLGGLDERDNDDDAPYEHTSDVGPDFVNLDEKLEALDAGHDTSLKDEDYVRRLVKREKASGGVVGAWLGGMLGWPLFAVEESDDDAEDDDDDDDDDADDADDVADEDENADDAEDGDHMPGSRGEDDAGSGCGSGKNRHQKGRAGTVRFEGAVADEAGIVPPPSAEEGGWQDAAWLLSVASRVIL